MTEAAIAVCDWALAAGPLSRVWATCDTGNGASARVLEKAVLRVARALRAGDRSPEPQAPRPAPKPSLLPRAAEAKEDRARADPTGLLRRRLHRAHAHASRCPAVGWSTREAVHDPDPERAAALAARYGAAVVGEDELLDRVDAVYVTTWTSEHPRLVERPPPRQGDLLREAPGRECGGVERMPLAVSGRAVPNQVGLVLRSARAVSLPETPARRTNEPAACSRWCSATISTSRSRDSTTRTGARTRRAQGRGALLEHSIHDLDILAWLLGPVRALSAATREVHGFPRIDDVTVARFGFQSGALASLTSVWHDVLERPSPAARRVSLRAAVRRNRGRPRWPGALAIHGRGRAVPRRPTHCADALRRARRRRRPTRRPRSWPR